MAFTTRLFELDCAVTIAGLLFGVFHAIVRFLMSSAVVTFDFRTLGGGPAGLLGSAPAVVAVVLVVVVLLLLPVFAVVVEVLLLEVLVAPVLVFQRSRMAFLSSLVVVPVLAVVLVVAVTLGVVVVVVVLAVTLGVVVVVPARKEDEVEVEVVEYLP